MPVPGRAANPTWTDTQRNATSAGVNQMRPLTDRELDSIHWRTMALTLPEEGVAREFPDEASCQKRLIEVRWPAGLACPKCTANHPTWMPGRSAFQCNNCRYQFSVTTGTALHRTRLTLGMWFRITEALIELHYNGYENFHLSVHTVLARFGISYATAYRTRKLILTDIQRGGEGLLSRAICVRPLPPAPIRMRQESLDHIGWLVDIAIKRRAAKAELSR